MRSLPGNTAARPEIADALAVNLGHFHIVAVTDEKLCENPHSGADFNDGDAFAAVEGGGDTPGYREVSKEVLAESLFGFDFIHAGQR